MSTVAYPHIDVTENGKARIAGTGFTVRMLVEEQRTTGADAIELQRNHPQLTLGQVYGALAYYHDHKEEIDQEIEALGRGEEAIRPRLENAVMSEKPREAAEPTVSLVGEDNGLPVWCNVLEGLSDEDLADFRAELEAPVRLAHPTA
jgi:uncharacterized protein (DUF433 family)